MILTNRVFFAAKHDALISKNRYIKLWPRRPPQLPRAFTEHASIKVADAVAFPRAAALGSRRARLHATAA
jgi:hypothetical protein